MKTFSKQTNKWILSTVLMAALGSQYYFRVSSNQVYSIEMSSTATNASTVFTVTVTDKDKDKSDTEAKTVLIGCNTCGDEVSYTGTKTEIQKYISDLATFIDNKDAKAVAKAEVKPEPKPEAKPEKKAKEETALEKRRREREEKAEARELAKQEKEDKLAEEKEERTDRFNDQVEELADKCESKPEKLNCFVTGYARILTKFKGKNKIESRDVAIAYNTHIEKSLRTSLNTIQSREEEIAKIELSNGGLVTAESRALREQLVALKSNTFGVIDLLNSKVPSEYAIIKNKTIDTIKESAASTAITVNNNYKMFDQLQKAKKPAEATQAYAAAKVSEQALLVTTSSYKTFLDKSVSESGDALALDYYKTTYIPDMTKILSNLSNLTGFNKSLTDSSTGNTINQPGPTATPTTNVDNSRNARGTPINNGLTNNAINGINNQNVNNGVTWGTAGPTPTGTRLGVPLNRQ